MFLFEVCGSIPFSIPEDVDSRCAELAGAARDFSAGEVKNRADEIEAKKGGVMLSLLKEAGRLGLFRAGLPREYGGFELGQIATAMIAENVTDLGAFSVAFIGHTGIGTLPLLYYGNREQKARYLPRLSTGEIIGAFSLSERDAGSDASSIKVRAVKTRDGTHYILDGEKIFCTSAAIADLFTVFAKVDGEHITAFLIDRASSGLEFGMEREKMGILGSSNRSIELKGVRVPAENILGEVGQGYKIALNVINIGRLRLASACTGACKRLTCIALDYAKGRYQFGVPIANFELIGQKLALARCRTYLLESLVYRTAGAIDSYPSAIAAAPEFSLETTVAKVFGSEALSFVADEALQTMGGYGYIRDNPVERYYRDCRIYRIFEGTNEIGRLLIASFLLKMLKTGATPKSGGAKNTPSDFLVRQVESLKGLAINLAARAGQKLGEGIRRRQTISAAIADLVIWSYALDSGLGRALAVFEKGDMELFRYYSKICEVMIALEMPLLIARVRQAFINMGEELPEVISPIETDTDGLLSEVLAWQRNI